VRHHFKYYNIKEVGESDSGKTRLFNIHNNRTGMKLGQIRWYGAWRQYCFFPFKFEETVWSEGCLRDVNSFIRRLMEERRS